MWHCYSFCWTDTPPCTPIANAFMRFSFSISPSSAPAAHIFNLWYTQQYNVYVIYIVCIMYIIYIYADIGPDHDTYSNNK